MSFDLTGMKADTDLQAEHLCAGPDGTGTMNRPAWSVEGQEEAIASRLDFLATESVDLVPNHAVVIIQAGLPSAVTHVGSQPS